MSAITAANYVQMQVTTNNKICQQMHGQDSYMRQDCGKSKASTFPAGC